MNKFRIIISVILVCLAVACVVHTATEFVLIANDAYTSAPPTVSLLLTVPYVAAIVLCAVVFCTVSILQKQD